VFIHEKEKGNKVYEIIVDICKEILNFGYIWFIDVFIFNIMNFEDFFQKHYSLFVKRTWMHNIYGVESRCIQHIFSFNIHT
jgi:hypothetical protein